MNVSKVKRFLNKFLYMRYTQGCTVYGTKKVLHIYITVIIKNICSTTPLGTGFKRSKMCKDLQKSLKWNWARGNPERIAQCIHTWN